MGTLVQPVPHPDTLELLADFCAADSLAELLSLTGLTPAELLEAIESDDARRQLDAYHRLIEIKRRLAEAKAALAATQRLADLTADPDAPPETARKAAAAILRPKRTAPAPRPTAEPPTTRPTAPDTSNEPIAQAMGRAPQPIPNHQSHTHNEPIAHAMGPAPQPIPDPQSHPQNEPIAQAMGRDRTPTPIAPLVLEFLTAAPRRRASMRPDKPGGLSPPPPPPPRGAPAPRPRRPPPTPAPCRPPSTA